MYIDRHIEQTILKLSSSYPVVMVCGQRQVGKSTLLFHIKEEGRKYVTLDDANARRLASTDPELFFETYGYPLLIDEFQRVPSIILEIKRIIDDRSLKGENTAGLFWLTGSQKFHMMKDVSESLAGRVAVLDMSGLTRAEIAGEEYKCFTPDIKELKHVNPKQADVHDIYNAIFKGSMPKVIAEDIERERYYMDYINTYLERDVKDLAQVGKLDAFYDFLVCIAARTGQQLVYEDIANTVGISSPTVKSWISILDRSGIVFILHPYHTNISKRLVKTPKIYFMDTGLAAYLCRWSSAETLESGAMSGAFFETYVVSELVKNYYNAGRVPDLYYYRDIDKKEIDILIVRDGKAYPIEVKKNKLPDKPDKNFGILGKLGLEVCTGLAICLCNEIMPYSRDCYLVPVTVI